MKIKRVIMVTFITMALLLSLITAFGFDFERRDDICAVKPIYKNLIDGVQCTGTITGGKKQIVTVPTLCVITEVPVSRGDHVEDGELLFKATLLDPSDDITVYKSFTDENTEGEEVCIYAPFDGVCSQMTIYEGKSAMPELSYILLVSLDELVMDAELDEIYYSKVEIGQTAQITVEAYPDSKLLGVVENISSEASVSGGLASELLNQGKSVIKLSIRLTGFQEGLIPGLSASSVIITDIYKKSPMLPCQSVMQDEKGNEYVFKVVNGILVKNYIETGVYYNDMFAIKSSISPDDIFMFSPGDNTHGGDKVEISSYYSLEDN